MPGHARPRFAIHGWIYDIKDGLLRDLGLMLTGSADFDALTLRSIAPKQTLNR